MKRLAATALLAAGLAGCAADYAAYPGYDPAFADAAALPPLAHEWDHGPPWSEGEAPWAPAPAWAALPPEQWGWSAPVLGTWAAAPVVSIGIGSGWWWGYRPWPRYGWWGPGWSAGWRSYGFGWAAPAWRPYAWATPGWRAPAWGWRGYAGGWRGPAYGGWGGSGWRPSTGFGGPGFRTAPGFAPPPAFRTSPGFGGWRPSGGGFRGRRR